MCSSRPKLLIVDDRPENLLALEALLEDLDIEIHKATSGNDALAVMLQHEFAVVLMDVQMPGMDGFETVSLMKQSRRTREVPVLYLTAISKDERHVFKGYEVGAVDYIFKPVEPLILRGKISVLVALDRTRRELAERNRQLEEATRKLEAAAMTDPLTGLHNRRFLHDNIEKDAALAMRAAWSQAKALSPDPRNRYLGFLLLDIDHFKLVNDTHGHDAGDAVLLQFARVLRDAVRQSDDVVRWGGEEFLVLLRQSNRDQVGSVAERIRSNVASFRFETPSDEVLSVTCSIGFCCYPLLQSEIFTWEDAISLADAALRHAKENGRNRVIGLKLNLDHVDDESRRIILHDLATARERELVQLLASDRADACAAPTPIIPTT